MKRFVRPLVPKLATTLRQPARCSHGHGSTITRSVISTITQSLSNINLMIIHFQRTNRNNIRISYEINCIIMSGLRRRWCCFSFQKIKQEDAQRKQKYSPYTLRVQMKLYIDLSSLIGLEQQNNTSSSQITCTNLHDYIHSIQVSNMIYKKNGFQTAA